MPYFKKRGDHHRYYFVDRLCVGRKCFHAGLYHDSPRCMNNAYHGCPSGPVGERKEPCDRCQGSGLDVEPCQWCGNTGELIIVGLPVVDFALASKRKADGWKLVAP